MERCAGSLLAKAQLPIFFPAGKLQQPFQTPWTASNQAVPSEQQKWLLAVMDYSVAACRPTKSNLRHVQLMSHRIRT